MNITRKQKTVTSYRLKLSEKEAQDLLSDIVDVIHDAQTIRNYTGTMVNERFAALAELKARLQGF